MQMEREGHGKEGKDALLISANFKRCS